MLVCTQNTFEYILNENKIFVYKYIYLHIRALITAISEIKSVPHL